MLLSSYIEEIKLKLTGNFIGLELDDSTITQLINSALREVQRYIDTTKLITIPYKPCMDLTQYKVSSVVRIFRTNNYAMVNSEAGDNKYAEADPMWLSMWQMLSGAGNTYNIQDWGYNYAAWNTALQTRNTLSTDLVFRFDKHTNNLYVNCAFDTPKNITIEYIPVYQSVEEIVSDYWIDMIINLALALAKVIIGRIRSKFTQSNALWALDTGILEEGQQELADLREQMKANNQLIYGID